MERMEHDRTMSCYLTKSERRRAFLNYLLKDLKMQIEIMPCLILIVLGIAAFVAGVTAQGKRILLFLLIAAFLICLALWQFFRAIEKRFGNAYLGATHETVAVTEDEFIHTFSAKKQKRVRSIKLADIEKITYYRNINMLFIKGPAKSSYEIGKYVKNTKIRMIHLFLTVDEPLVFCDYLIKRIEEAKPKEDGDGTDIENEEADARVQTEDAFADAIALLGGRSLDANGDR